VPSPLRKPNCLSDNMEWCSIHQSNRVLSICSVILHNADDRAIGRYATGLVLALGMEITLKRSQESGIVRLKTSY